MHIKTCDFDFLNITLRFNTILKIVEATRYIFVQNFIKLKAAVHMSVLVSTEKQTNKKPNYR